MHAAVSGGEEGERRSPRNYLTAGVSPPRSYPRQSKRPTSLNKAAQAVLKDTRMAEEFAALAHPVFYVCGVIDFVWYTYY